MTYPRYIKRKGKVYGPYYYKSVRDKNGNVQAIYVGRKPGGDLKQAVTLRSILKERKFNLWISVFLVFLILGSVLIFQGAIVGYFTVLITPEITEANLTLEFAFQSEDFLPKDMFFKVDFNNQTSSLTLDEFVNKSGYNVILSEGNFYSEGTDLAGFGHGYGIGGERISYPNVSFQFNLSAYGLNITEIPYNVTNVTILTLFNETTNETVNQTIDENITFYNVSEELTLLRSKIINGSCNYNEPFHLNIEGLMEPNTTNYSVSLVSGSVMTDNTSLDDSFISFELIGNDITARTNYSETERGYGEGFISEGKTIVLGLEEFEITMPNESGTYPFNLQMIHNGTILKDMRKNVTVSPFLVKEVEEVPEEIPEENISLRLFVKRIKEFLPEKRNFRMDEKPRFKFTWKKVFSERRVLIEEGAEPESLDVFVYDPDEKPIDVETIILETGKGEFEIEIPKERAFRAGLYKIRMEAKEGKETYVKEEEFLWGVLAINTHKSTYLENEQAFIGIAVLNDEGHMVCDSKVTLEITDPKGETKILRTSDGTIEVSKECEVYGVTNLPDYYAYYTVNTEGTYTMNLTAVTRNGVRSITDTFEVREQVDFDVERDGPTRIYPPAKYRMVFTVKANRGYNGLVREYVPAGFEITPQDGLTITISEDTRVLEWGKRLVTGETYQLAYEFDAPDISPYLFTLGALEIGNWKEAREWMIASDAPEQYYIDTYIDSSGVSRLNEANMLDGANDEDHGQVSHTGNSGYYYYDIEDTQQTGEIPGVNYVRLYISHYMTSASNDDVTMGHELGSTSVTWSDEGGNYPTGPSPDTTEYIDITSDLTTWYWENITDLQIEFTYAKEAAADNINHFIDTVWIEVDYTPPDQPPNVTLNSPPSDSWNTSQTVTFGYTPIDDQGFSNCSLWTNETTWSKKEDNTSAIVNGSINTITETFGSDGIYLWNVECYDNATTPQKNSSVANYTIKIDSTNPTASLGTNPTEGYEDYDGSVTFDLKCSDNMDVNTLQLWGNWSGWHANQTNSSPVNDTWWNVTVNGIPEGTWKWDAYCNDSSGRYDWSDVNRTFTVIIDDPPFVTNVTVTPQKAKNSTNINITANISDEETYPDTVIAILYYPNETFWQNVTMFNSEDIYWNDTVTVNFYPHGTYNITIFANDTNGNVNSSESTWFAPYLNLSDEQEIIINGSFEDWMGVENVTDILGDSGESGGTKSLTKNTSYWNNPDITMKEITSPDPLTVNQPNTINVTINVTNGNGTTGFNWSVNVSLWNTNKLNDLNITAWNYTSKAQYNSDLYGIAAVDMDNDGDVDIVSSNRMGYDMIIYENPGNTANISGWTQYLRSISGIDYYSLTVGDIDNDGDNDIIGGANNEVLLFENPGSIDISQWNYTLDIPIGSGVWSLDVGDLDNDGDLDILVGTQNGGFPGDLSIYENPGNVNSTNISRWSVSNKTTLGITSIAVGDLDNDGDDDIITGGDETDVYVWNNPGNENSTNISRWNYTVNTPVGSEYGLAVGDVDNDGDLDIISAYVGFPDKIFILENPNNSINVSEWNFTVRTIVSLVAIVVGDLDNDGDIDIVGGGDETDNVYVWVNPGNENSTNISTWREINKSFSNEFGSFDLGDIDNDGDLDIIAGRLAMVIALENSDVASTYINSSVKTFINQSNNASTYSLFWTPSASGNYTLMAIADNTGSHAEVLENNNRIILNVTVGSAPPDFDFSKVSLANNNSYLFAKMRVAGSVDLSSSNEYYRLFISINDSSGNQTNPENENLPFKYDYRVQVNGSSCYVFNYSDYSNNISSCLFNESGSQMEVAVPLNILEAVSGDKYNITFETGSLNPGRYDAAPDYRSFLEYELNGTVDFAAPIVTDVNVTPQKAKNGTNINITANVTDSPAGVETVIARIYYPNGTSWQNVTMFNSEDIYWNDTVTVNFYPHGTYNITIWANDTSGNVNDSEKTWFAPYLSLSNEQEITINGSFEDWAGVENVTDVVGDSSEPIDVDSKSLTKNISYWNNPDITMKEITAPDPLILDQANTISVTINVTNGNGTNGFNWSVNVSLWNTTKLNDLDIGPWDKSLVGLDLDVRSLATADVDADGDIDIVAVGGDYIYIWENPDNNVTISGWNSTTVDIGVFVYAVAVADIDNDGDADIMGEETVFGPNFYIFENPGNENSSNITTWNSTNITHIGGIYEFAVADLDNDGDIDIISGDADNNVTIWENPGNENSTNISKWNSTNALASDYVYSVFAADLDNDNDTDIISGDKNNDVTIWENPGNSINISEWNYTNASVGDGDVYSVFAGDIDNDGDLDIVSANSGTQDYVIIWENPGNSINISEWNYTNASAYNFVFSVAVFDLDNDGDLDIISGETARVYVRDNPNASINISEWSKTYQSVGPYTPHSVSAADLDNDGDMDVIAGTGDGSYQIYVFENSDAASTYINSSVKTFINQSGNATTYSLNWTPGATGNYTLMAIADNTGSHKEVLENNNRIVMNVTVSSGVGGEGSEDFDLKTLSLANNASYLFARIQVNGSINLSDSSEYHRLFISINDSSGNQTTPEGENLPFRYDYRVQINGSSCYVFNHSDYENNISSCLFNYSGSQMEVALNLSVINLSLGESANITFEAGSSNPGSYDSAPDKDSFLSYDVEEAGDFTPPTIHLISPPNETITSIENQTFTCNITDSGGIANLTLYIWNSTNDEIYTNTTNLTGTENETSWDYTFPYMGTFEWNCFGYDNSNNSAWSEQGNYTITYSGIKNCTNITDSGTYYLQNNIPNSPETVCINISTSDVTLDCQGYGIQGDDSGSDYGIYAESSSGSEYENITIKNCNVTQWYRGINWIYVDNSEIENITANDNIAEGVYLALSDDNNLTNITANDDDSRGLRLYYSNNNILTNITAKDNGEGVYLQNSGSNQLTNLTLLNNTNYDFYVTGTSATHCNQILTDVTGTDNKPIVYYNDSVTIEGWDNNVSEIVLCNADNSVINNVTLNHTDKENNGILLVLTDSTNITNTNAYNVYHGVQLYNSDDNNLTNITANSNARSGLYLNYYAEDNTLTNITANNNTYFGLYLYFSADNNILTNITANNSTWYGVYLDNSDDNTLTNVTANSNSKYGLWLGNANNNTVIDSNLTGNTDKDVYVNSNTASDTNYLLNTTFDKSSVTIANANSGSLYVQWYLDVYVNDSASSPVDGATVTGWMNNGSQEFSDTTASNGYIPRQNLNEYMQNFTGKFYRTNYTVNATKSGDNASTQVNLTESMSITLTLPNIYSCANITSPGTYYLTQNIPNSPETICMNISTSNVTLDCQDYYIQGQDTISTYGIYAKSSSGSEYQNITIENCNVTDWYFGIYWWYVNNSRIGNMTVNNNSRDGLYIYGSNNNTLINITANNNAWQGMYLSSLKNNQLINLTLLNNTFYDLLLGTDSDSECNNIFTNVIGTDNKPIVYYNSSVTIEDWDNNASMIILCNADNSLINNVTVNHTDVENNGIWLERTDSTNITNTRVYNSRNGLAIYDGANNTIIINLTVNSNALDGVQIASIDNINLTNITANDNARYGISLFISNNNRLVNITANSNSQHGVFLSQSDNNTLTNSRMEGNTNYGLYLNTAGQTNPNIFYNNLFNNTNNVDFVGTTYNNTWNTTEQAETRIYSNGTEIGGNYWTNPSGTGFSDTCDDDDTDGFCNDAYNVTDGDACTPEVNCSDNTDYLPYSNKYDAPPTASIGTNPVALYADFDGSIVFDLKCFDVVGVDTLQLWGNWSGWHANQTNSTPVNDTWWNVTVNGIPEGTWKWDAWCNDTIGQGDWSEVNRTFTVDLTNPNASMGTNPAEGYEDNDGTVTFDLKCSDNFHVDTLQLWGNWTGTWEANQTNSTPLNNTFWNKTVSGIPTGTHKWGVYCNDSVGRYNWSDNRTLTVDLQDPQIGNKYMNESGSVVTDTIVCLNVSGISDNIGVDTVWTTVTQSNGSVFNISMSDTGSCAGGSGDGWYSVNVNVGDSSGTFFYNTTYVNDSSGRMNSNTTVLNLSVSAACDVDFQMTSQLQAGIRFSEQDPGEVNVSAVDNGDYNVTDLSTAACGTVNVSIRATDDLVNGSSKIGIGNVTVNSTSPDSETIQLSTSYQLIRSGVPAGENNVTTLYFWLTVPSGQDPKYYNTTIYIREEKE